MELDTHIDLLDLLLDSIYALLHGQNLNDIPVKDSVQHVAQSQGAIGWSELLKGRLSNAWKSKQQEHLGGRATAKKNGQTWATQVAAKLLELWLDLWHERNMDRHGRDSTTRAEAEKRQAIYELHQLYEHKNNIPATHQWILARPIETLLQWPSYMLVAFLGAYKPIIDGFITDEGPPPVG